MGGCGRGCSGASGEGAGGGVEEVRVTDRFGRFLRALVPDDVAAALEQMDDDACAAALKKYIEENRAEVSVRLFAAREKADAEHAAGVYARQALPNEYRKETGPWQQ